MEPPANSPVINKPSIKVPVILMIWPVASLVIIVAIYALLNVMFNQAGIEARNSIAFRLTNIVMLLIGMATVAGGPISFIIGLVLLIVRLNERRGV